MLQPEKAQHHKSHTSCGSLNSKPENPTPQKSGGAQAEFLHPPGNVQFPAEQVCCRGEVRSDTNRDEGDESTNV